MSCFLDLCQSFSGHYLFQVPEGAIVRFCLVIGFRMACWQAIIQSVALVTLIKFAVLLEGPFTQIA